MNEHKICFIICSNNDFYLTECFHYLANLRVPDEYIIETLVIPDAKSIAAGYNEGMRASDAKYKIYLHQDTFIINPDFLQHILDIFHADAEIGMIGMIGAEHLCWDGVMFHEKRIGNFHRLEKMIANGAQLDIEIIHDGYAQVEVVDGLMMITQYDIPWREDIINGWDFYDVSQCLEFRRAGYKIVVPGQQKAWYIHDCEIPSFWNYEAARKKTLAAYPDFFSPKKSFFYCNTDVIKSQHLPWGLMELGYEVRIDSGEAHVQDYDERSKDEFAERLKVHMCDYVISFNMSPEIAQACYEEGVPYIVWCYDSPLKELHGWFAAYPTNHIFAMDKEEIKRLESKKIPHLHYMHLAGNVTRMQGLIIEAGDEEKYGHEVAMVGSMYDKGNYEDLLPKEDNHIRREILSFVSEPVGDWRKDTIILDRLSDETVAYLANNYADAQKQFSMDNRLYYEALLARAIAHEERKLVLGELSKDHSVYLYTGSTKGIPEKVHVMGTVDPYVEAPKIFHLSKINLNITLRSIQTGIPQRVFDVMAVGGFMMSNYQRDLEELFVPDKEIVLFQSIEELKDKVNYYLRHENQRFKIAVAGYHKIKECYSFPKVLEKIISIVEKD